MGEVGDEDEEKTRAGGEGNEKLEGIALREVVADGSVIYWTSVGYRVRREARRTPKPRGRTRLATRRTAPSLPS